MECCDLSVFLIQESEAGSEGGGYGIAISADG